MAEDVLAPNAFTMTEFGAYHGCCGQDASLMLLHTRNPTRWPLNLPTLNAIVAEQIADGYADASLSGGQTIYSAVRWMREKQNIPVSVYGWDPSQNTGGVGYSLALLHTTLQAQIGTNPDGTHYWKRPVLIEIQTTGSGLPEDEHNVLVHFIGVPGVELPNGGWFRVDGDAVSYNDPNGGLKPPILTGWSELVAASPIAFAVIELDPSTGGVDMPIPPNWTDSNNGDASILSGVLTAPNGEQVTGGFRQHILTRNPAWPEALVPVDAEHPGGAGITIQDFALKQFWNATTGQLGETTGEAISHTVTVTVEDPAQAQKITDLTAQVDALTTQVSELQAQLELAQNTNTKAVALVTAIKDALT